VELLGALARESRSFRTAEDCLRAELKRAFFTFGKSEEIMMNGINESASQYGP
jgi:hypothetical protein